MARKQAIKAHLTERKTQGLSPAAAQHVDTLPMDRLLSGQPVSLMDHGRARTFELALDELYVRDAPVGQRLLSIVKQADAATLLRYADTLREANEVKPQLVLYPVGLLRTASSRRVLTDQLMLTVSNPIAADRAIAEAGLKVRSRPAYAPNTIIAETTGARVGSVLEVVARLNSLQGFTAAIPLLARQQVRKTTIPNDPYFSQQWHLRNTGQGQGKSGTDVAIVNTWDTYKGTGVTIGIVDDGVQLTHPDLAPNADSNSSHHYDWNDSPEDNNPAPNPSNDDFHGTSVAGVAAGRGGNGVGVSGAAPLATIVGFRLIADLTTDDEEAEAMTKNNDVIHIKSNSWGTPDSEPWILGDTGPLFRAALESGVSSGRGGLGIIYPWAAGNGRDIGDQANKDGYANSIYVLPVGAITNAGALAYYSETGSNLVVSAPSSSGTLDIVTTDLVGDVGYNINTSTGNLSDRNYTNDFGGTSSAAPLVSGVVALMLEANPDLTWRDVKEILLRSSTKLSPTDAGWVTRTVGDPSLSPIKHNEKFGGGMVNAQAAVAMAETWVPRGPMVQSTLQRAYGNPGAPIADNSTGGVVTNIDFGGEPAMRVEHVEVSLAATHAYRGDLQVLLTSPGGVVSTLAAVEIEDSGDSGHYEGLGLNSNGGWIFSSVRHWGESSLGVWKVTVRDLAAGDVGTVESVVMRISGIAAPPQDIAVEEPAGTNLLDDTSTVDFADVATDNLLVKSFTIKNIGDSALTGIAASIDGADATDFTLSVLPTSLGKSTSTTFTVTFAPATTGAKQATLHILSNDPDEASFDIELVGNATPPVGTITFADTGYTVLESAGVAHLNLTRQGGSFGAVAVAASTSNSSALSGSDFTALTTSPVNFSDGGFSASFTVNITDSTTNEANETFFVTLSNPTNRVRLGNLITVPVTIIDSSSLSQTTDTAVPAAPTITAPLANAPLSIPSGGSISITGTAADNKGIEKVEIELNNRPAVNAILATPGAPSTSYTRSFSEADGLVTGSNTLKVTSVDYSGRRSSVVTRSFKILRSLGITVDLPAYGSVTPGYSPSSDREVGKSYTVVATAKAPATGFAGGIFTGWTLGGVDVENGNASLDNTDTARIGVAATAMAKSSLTFIFREGMTLTAHFVESPFSASIAGTYNGLVKPSSSAPTVAGTISSNSTEGHLNATVQNTGAFSGRLTIDGFSLNIAGNFDHLGKARFGTAKVDTLTVPRTGKPSLTLKLDLGLPGNVAPLPAPGKMVGEVSATEFKRSTVVSVSLVNADRSPFTGLSGAVVPDAYLTLPTTTPLPASPTGRTDGVFTVVMQSVPILSQPARISSAGYTASDLPQGDGIATLKVTKSGVVSLNGNLADGTAITASGTLSQDLEVALFAQLYNKLGFYSVLVKLDSSQLDSDLKTATGAEAVWARPFIGTSHYYPYGWREVIKTDFLGAKYAVVANQSSLNAPDGTDIGDIGDKLHALTVDGNATLTFMNGRLDSSLIKRVNVSTTDGVVKVPDNDPTFSLAITRANGALSGSFTHTDDSVPVFKGILYQKGPNAGGYGHFLTKQPTVIDYTGESGAVILIGQPE